MASQPGLQQRLRKALLQAFPKSEELKIVVSDADIGMRFTDYLASAASDYEAALLNFLEEVEARNRFEDLLRSARERNDTNESLNDVFREVMNPIEQELVGLEPLLKPLDQGAARLKGAWELYDGIAWQGWPFRLRSGCSLLELVRNVARMPARDGIERSVPLLSFVQGLCDQVKKEGGSAEVAALVTWLGRAEAALGVTRGAGAAAAAGRDRRAWGIIRVQIRPLQMAGAGSNANQPTFGVKAWLLGTDRDSRLTVKSPEPGANELEGKLRDVERELPDLINRWREEVLDLGVPLDTVRFEFVVPRALMGCKFDRLPVPRPIAGTIPLGAEHPMLIRPWERAELGEKQQIQMRARYGVVFDRERDPCTVINSFDDPVNGGIEAYLLPAGATGGNPLYLSLKRRLGCCLCLLESAPPPTVDDPQNDLFNTLLGSFVPAVMWLREQPPAGKPYDELCSLVKNVPLGRVPDRVWEARQNAEIQAKTPWHRGRHLTLIWDDPRFPASPDIDPENRARSAR